MSKKNVEGLTRVRTYQTSDGEVFTDKDVANNHQKCLNFKNYYDDGNDIHREFEDAIPFDIVNNWLLNNKEEILKYLV